MSSVSTPTLNYSDVFLGFPLEKGEPLFCMVRDHLLVYVYHGELEIRQGNETVTVQAGECVFVRKNHRVSLTRKSEDDKPFQAIFLVFCRTFLREYYRNTCKSGLPKDLKDPETNKLIYVKQTPDIISLFQSMVPYLNSDKKPSDEIVYLKLQEGIHALLNIDMRAAASLFDFAQPWKIDLKEFMDGNYMYELSAEEIASFTGRSLATFKRDFQKISNLPPQKWIIRRRLQEANRQLKEEGRKVSDIYLDMGFKSLSHFSQAYKREYGQAPTKCMIDNLT